MKHSGPENTSLRLAIGNPAIQDLLCELLERNPLNIYELALIQFGLTLMKPLGEIQRDDLIGICRRRKEIT